MGRFALLASCVSVPVCAIVVRQPQFMGEIRVPVIEVVVTDDVGDAQDNTTFGLQKLSRQETEQEKCAKEMFQLAFNETRVIASHACEQKRNSTQTSVKQLEQGDVPAALANVEQTFRECAAMSESCARQMAPDVVRKMRLSGLAVDQQCKQRAQKLEKDELSHKRSNKTASCEDNATHGMVDGLQHNDIDKAMTEAQHALKTCNGLTAPCDFQLAPMLVGNLLELSAMMEQAQMAQFLMASLNAAQQVQAKMAGASAKGHAKGHKAPMSLLSLATSTRISSKTGLLKF